MVLRAAELDTDLPSTSVHKGKLSLTGEIVVRDKGHDGMTLADFCALAEAKEAKLSEAEVGHAGFATQDNNKSRLQAQAQI